MMKTMNMSTTKQKDQTARTTLAESASTMIITLTTHYLMPVNAQGQ